MDKVKIMIVDDEPETLEPMKLLFEANDNFEVLDFIKAEKALEYLNNENNEIPNIIVSDIYMPGMDGYQFGELVRNKVRLVNIPFLYLTAKTGFQDKVKARIVTPHFFPKDGSRQELVTVVQSILNERLVKTGMDTLTRLPGSSIITVEINEILKTKDRYSIFYMDLDNFKAYNDVYGTDAGDDAIKAVANALDSAFKKIVLKTYFLGHIGGDDFAAAAWGDFYIDVLCKALDGQMESVRKNIYKKTDLERGYTELKNRKGEIEKYNLITLSMGIVNSEIKKVKNWAEASNLLIEVLRKAKEAKRRLILY